MASMVSKIIRQNARRLHLGRVLKKKDDCVEEVPSTAFKTLKEKQARFQVKP